MAGSVVQRPHQKNTNSWTIVWDVPSFGGGRKRKYMTFSGTKREAKIKLAEKITDADQGRQSYGGATLVGTFLKEWLAEKKPTVELYTWETYALIVNARLLPAFGHIKLTQLTTATISKVYRSWMEDGKRCGRKDCTGCTKCGQPLSARTIRAYNRVLSMALRDAQRAIPPLVTMNVAEHVRMPKQLKKTTKVLEEAEVTKLLDHLDEMLAKEPYGNAIGLALLSGIRRGEVLALHDFNISEDRQTISITHAVSDPRTAPVFIKETPKTRSSRRTIALSPRAMVYLKREKTKRAQNKLRCGAAWKGGSLIFCDGDGSIIRPDRLTKSISSVLKRAGVTSVRLHDLRHTHATILLQNGADRNTVKERLGHSSIAVTSDIYDHVDEKRGREAADLFDKAIQKG